MAFKAVDLVKFIGFLALRIIFDLICLILSPLIFIFYRSICDSSLPKDATNSTKKQFSSILITGASSGIGQATAHHFALQSKQRLKNDEPMILHLISRNMERLNAVKQECLELSGCSQSKNKSDAKLKVYTYSADITNEEKLSSIILGCDDIRALDLLFANAGINYAMSKSDDFVESTKDLVNINILGTMNTIFPILRRFMKRKSGHIAVTASLAGYTNRKDCAMYSATKAFLRFMCEVMHWGLHNFYNIDVTLVNPGYVQTPMVYKESGDKSKGLDSKDAASIIVNGIENNDYSIDFPFGLSAAAWIMGSAHPIIRTCIGKLAVKQENVDRIFPNPK